MNMKLSKLAALVAAVSIAAACSFNAQPDLPSRADIVPGKEITVQGNETVYAIARTNGVSMREIIVLNNLQPPFALKPGQKLTLPAKPGDQVQALMPASPSNGAIEEQPLPPPSQTANNQKGILGLPVAGAAPSAEMLTTPTSSKSVSTTAPQTPPPTTNIANAQLAPIAPEEKSSTAPSDDAAQPSFTMVWPVQGPILSSFGPKGKGFNNDGINIGAPKGSPVVAAAGGIVVYAGNEMKGFGNLVLIRHADGWVTAYAHLDRVLVTKDAVVAQGDEIGTVGNSGGVSSPQLHFETRLNGKPVDPDAAIGNK